MKNKHTWHSIISLVIITILSFTYLVGCGNSAPPDLKVEQTLLEVSKSQENAFKFYPEYTSTIRRNQNKLEIQLSQAPDTKLAIYINSDFYDKIPMKPLQYSSKKEVPQSFYSMLEKAQEKVTAYIDSSTFIKLEDKDQCKEYVQSVTVKNGIPIEAEDGILMQTDGNTIYINNNLFSHIKERAIIHELIHVISNCTNSSQSNNLSAYRFSMLNEAITELIARELSDEYKLSPSDYAVVYEDYFVETYLLMRKMNLLEAYFYSDKYDDAKAKYSSEVFDLIVLVMNNFADETQNADNLSTMLSIALNKVYCTDAKETEQSNTARFSIYLFLLTTYLLHSLFYRILLYSYLNNHFYNKVPMLFVHYIHIL